MISIIIKFDQGKHDSFLVLYDAKEELRRRVPLLRKYHLGKKPLEVIRCVYDPNGTRSGFSRESWPEGLQILLQELQQMESFDRRNC